MLRCINCTPAHRQRGFSLLPQALGVAVLGIVMTLGLQQLLPLRGAAEQAQVQTVTGGLQSALGLETVRRVLAHGDLSSLKELHGSNPVLLLEEPPLNYRGELTAGPGDARGQWYFDPSAGELAYQPRYPQYLCKASEPTILRWRVAIQRHSDGQPRSVGLQPQGEYRWRCHQ